MSPRQVSRGTCYFCKGSFAKSGMARHLRACDARKAAEAEIEPAGARQTKLFHIVADGYRAYWLHLEMPTDATLQDLDEFLRAIWLECCGHLSEFTIGHMRFDSHPEVGWGKEQGMDVALSDVLSPKMEFAHAYDFGSTTHLNLRVLSEREGWISLEEEPVRILARNEPPDITCEGCGKPATQVDVWGDYAALCDECAETSEYDEEGLMPIVNSPRAGVCGYTGPWEPERFEPPG